MPLSSTTIDDDLIVVASSATTLMRPCAVDRAGSGASIASAAFLSDVGQRLADQAAVEAAEQRLRRQLDART